MTLHHTLYRKLKIVIPTLPHVPEYVKSKVPGLMDLNLRGLVRSLAVVARHDSGSDASVGGGQARPSVA